MKYRTFKGVMKSWIRIWGNARIGTEYPSKSVYIIEELKASKYNPLALTEDECVKIEKCMLELRDFDRFIYEIFKFHFYRKKTRQEITDYRNAKKIGKKKYYSKLAKAESFLSEKLKNISIL